jgi:hypothetical protein
LRSTLARCGVDCYPKGCAAPDSVQCQCHARGPLSKLERAPPQRKINVTSKSPVGDISVVTLIRTDTTLDHSQKAEKVWRDSIGATDENDIPTRSDSFPQRADFRRMSSPRLIRCRISGRAAILCGAAEARLSSVLLARIPW